MWPSDKNVWRTWSKLSLRVLLQRLHSHCAKFENVADAMVRWVNFMKTFLHEICQKSFKTASAAWYQDFASKCQCLFPCKQPSLFNFSSKLSVRPNTVAQPPQKVLGGEPFAFKQATGFCLGHHLSKHKMTRYARNLGDPWPPCLRP